jgi:hypothetical protein
MGTALGLLETLRSNDSVCSHLLTLVPRSRIFLSWRWRRYVPPKCRFIQDLHSATSQKTAFFVVTAVKTSNLIKQRCVWHGCLCIIVRRWQKITKLILSPSRCCVIEAEIANSKFWKRVLYNILQNFPHCLLWSLLGIFENRIIKYKLLEFQSSVWKGLRNVRKSLFMTLRKRVFIMDQYH